MNGMSVHDWYVLTAVAGTSGLAALILLGLFGGDIADGLRWLFGRRGKE